jgi:hypothetical protein
MTKTTARALAAKSLRTTNSLDVRRARCISKTVRTVQVIFDSAKAHSATAGRGCTAHQSITAKNNVEEMRTSIAAAFGSGSDVSAHEGIAKPRDAMLFQLASGAGCFCNCEHKHGAETRAGTSMLLPPMSWIVGDAEIEITATGYSPNLLLTVLSILSQILRFITRKT